MREDSFDDSDFTDQIFDDANVTVEADECSTHIGGGIVTEALPRSNAIAARQPTTPQVDW